MRTNGVLTWVLSDHLGSASVTADEGGTKLNETRYTAFGEVREGFSSLETGYEYTRQLSQMEEIGLYYYVARWYDAVTAHFGSADSIIPEAGKAAAFDRYAYTNNNPIKYTDSSGHCVDGLTTVLCAAAGGALIGGAIDAFIQYNATGSVDMREVFSAAAAGAVSGTVIAVAAPPTIIGAVVAGGLANMAGAQASAAYDAFVKSSGGSFWRDFAAEGAFIMGLA